MISQPNISLKAYTLTDVFAGMVIMSIVVGIVFTTFSMVNRQIHDFQKNRIAVNDFMMLSSSLQWKMELAYEIQAIPSGFLLLNESGETFYTIEEGKLMSAEEGKEHILQDGIAGIEIVSELDQTTDHLVISQSFNHLILKAHYFRPMDNAERINESLLNGN